MAPRRTPRCCWLLLVSLALPGCWRRERSAEPLTIDRTSPALGDPAAPVLLNDALTVYFSDPIQTLSVTPDTVALLDEQGHQVPGSLQVGENWVAFRPVPPVAPDLQDGSFRPGARYRLLLVGAPRPDGIRSSDGRWLESSTVFDVHVASLEQKPPGLPSILRPPLSDLPFVLRGVEADLPQPLAADAPRLQLHFTQPVLPGSVGPHVFDIRLLKGPIEALTPRAVRIVSSPLDDLPGSTVEIDLGALPQRADGSQVALREGDLLSVAVRTDRGLCDYAGNAPLPSPPSSWFVVAGAALPLCEWPSDEHHYPDERGLWPGFEVVAGWIRPRLRVEVGNGQLGAFRPQRDVVLRPGEPFDRGDGRLVVAEGADLCFASIEIPRGVRVVIDATGGPVRLRSCGGVRIEGELHVVGPVFPLPEGRFAAQPAEELLRAARVALVAAGDVVVTGAVTAEAAVGGAESSLLIATVSRMTLHGSLPFQSTLVFEARPGAPASRIDGSRGQCPVYPATFTYGVAPGTDLELRGVLPWRQLPVHVDAGVLRLGDARGGIAVAWQSAVPDALQADRPDVGAGRVARWQATRDGDLLAASPGAYVRLMLTGRARANEALPGVREIRLNDR